MTQGKATPPDVAGWTKGQVMVIYAQGRLRAPDGERRSFRSLREAWRYKKAQREASA